MSRKKKQLPLLENITITDVAAEGKALARVDDMVIFIPFVIPGDVVDVQITKKRKSYCEGRVVRFIQYSDNRKEPFCPHFGIANGKYFLTKTNLKPSINKCTTNSLALEKLNFQNSITF